MTREIRLSNGMVTLVDDADYEWLSQYHWCYNGTPGYACRYKAPRVSMLMHCEIMARPEGMHVDHINRNKLDNRRTNLRLATPAQNAMNRTKRSGTSSQYRGVSWNKRESYWQAHIRLNGKLIALGLFSSEVVAARAYDALALDYFGEFANPNFPQEA